MAPGMSLKRQVELSSQQHTEYISDFYDLVCLCHRHVDYEFKGAFDDVTCNKSLLHCCCVRQKR